MDEQEMKAKELITGKVNEGDEFGGTPPGATGSQHRPMPDRGMRRPGGPMPPRIRPGGPGGPEGMSGPEGMEEPQGFLNRDEQGKLKDILIQMLASLTGSDLDKNIGKKLMGGQELEPGELQHILDECMRLKLPPSHTPILQKIYTKLNGG